MSAHEKENHNTFLGFTRGFYATIALHFMFTPIKYYCYMIVILGITYK